MNENATSQLKDFSLSHLGDKEQAFWWLDKAFEERNGWLIHLKGNQRYDGLRNDTRYKDLVRRMNLP
jgi:hypothetical protein